MKGLEVVTGNTYEDVTRKLKEAGIRFEVDKEPAQHSDRPFFRSSSIYIFNEGRTAAEIMGLQDKVEKALGSPSKTHGGAYIYYAHHQISSRFDITQLNGRMTFEKGNLLESTTIEYI